MMSSWISGYAVSHDHKRIEHIKHELKKPLEVLQATQQVSRNNVRSKPELWLLPAHMAND